MTGKVKIEIIAGLYENFINWLVENDFYISSIKATDYGVTLVCRAHDYATIAKNARRFQCRTKILRKKGLYFSLKKIFVRRSVFVASAAVLLYIFLFSKLIWRIDVISPDAELNREIYAMLYQNDVYAGALFSQEKNQQLIQQIFVKYSDVGYVTMNFYKGALVCKIDPTVHIMPYLESSFSGNILATNDGIINDLRVYKGFSQLKVGQSVLKGDVLVSSTYIDKYGRMYQVMPRAYIQAMCERAYTAHTEFDKTIYLRTGEYTQKKTVAFMGKKIVLHSASAADFANYDTETAFEYVQVCGFRLPFTVETTKYYKKEPVQIKNDVESAYSAAKRTVDTIIEGDASLETVQTKEYSYSVSNSGVTVNCRVRGYYDITK